MILECNSPRWRGKNLVKCITGSARNVREDRFFRFFIEGLEHLLKKTTCALQISTIPGVLREVGRDRLLLELDLKEILLFIRREVV